LAIDEKILGQEHLTVANILTDLGELYYKEGKYSKAESCYQQALMIYEKVFGAEYPHPRLARTLHNYAVLLKRTKRTVEASELEERAKTMQAIYTQENAADSRSSV
jgi:tetratricopeptide (TPR) repeat protein